MPTIFVSYSHRDEEWKERVLLQLRVATRAFGIDVWDDRRVQSGQPWRAEIESALGEARVALLLVSANSLTSSFILNEELPALLRRRASEGLRLIPVILRPCAWEDVAWLSPIQGFPKDGSALSMLTEAAVDAALTELARDVARSVSPEGSVRADQRVTVPAVTPVAAAPVGPDPLAEYESLTLIHEGPYSHVWRARCDGELCVVKETTAPASRPALEAALELDCPNLAAPRRVWEDGARLYEELPYINGIRLSDLLEAGGTRLAGALLASLHQQLDRTLAVLHRGGVVHRDVNPDNLFLVVKAQEEVSSVPSRWAFDMFGGGSSFAQTLSVVGHAFGAAWVLGDPTFAILTTDHEQVACRHGSYTAPEQEVGAATPASDIYSLGATLYYAISGEPPPEPRGHGQPAIEVPPAQLAAYRLSGDVAQMLLTDQADRTAPRRREYSSVVDGHYGILSIGADSYIAMTEFGSSTVLLQGQAELARYRGQAE